MLHLCTLRSLLALSLVPVVAACAPELKQTYLTPDNASAKHREAGAKRPGASDPSKLPITDVDASDFASLVRGDLAPVCRAEGGKAVATADLEGVRAGIAAWNAARVATPAQASAKSAKNGGSIAVSTSSDTVTWTGKGPETRTLDALDVDCSGDRPVVAVNGQRHAVDVLYGRRVVTGLNVGLGAAAATNFVVLAGLDTATSKLVAIRAQTGHKSRLSDAAAKRWNGVAVRSLKGFVPDGKAPTVAKWVPGKDGNYATMQLVFADEKAATLVRGPVSFTADDLEGIEIVRLRAK